MAGVWGQTHPDQIAAIVPFIIALVGVVGAFLPDRLGKQKTRKTDIEETDEEIIIPQKKNPNDTGFNDK